MTFDQNVLKQWASMTGSSHEKSDLMKMRCDAFEAALSSGQRPDIEDFLGSVSGRERSRLLTALVQIERRWRNGEGTSSADDQQRFPDDSIAIEDAFCGSAQNTLLDGSDNADDGISTLTTAAGQPSTQKGSGANRPLPAGIAKPSKIGRYTVLQRLGRGGQGEVFRAVHPNLPIELAIKVSAKTLDKTLRDGVKREAQILCDLDHPNIARIRDLDFDDGRPFLVLDYIRGRTMRELLASGDHTDDQAIAWLAQSARAIAFAHRRGIVHLDLKPDNIVIDEQGNAKVIDFGLARMRGPWTDPSHETDRVSGTLQYMAPEQAEGTAQHIGAHSDVFALGAILYHVLTGSPPFTGKSLAQLVSAVRACDFDVDSLKHVDRPRSLIEACTKAMSVSPAERYASAEEFADCIEGHQDIVEPRSPAMRIVRLIVGLLFIFFLGWMVIAGVVREPRAVESPKQNQQAYSGADNQSTEPERGAESNIQNFTVTRRRWIGESMVFEGDLFNLPAAREYDEVFVTVKLERPAYCFLIALNPNGTIQLGYPELATEPQPAPTMQFMYPPETHVFELSDGAGTQAFVLIASDQPLPSFEQWCSDIPPLVWPSHAFRGNWEVSRSDRRRRVFGGEQRGAIVPKQEVTALDGLMRIFGSVADADVEAVVFEVQEHTIPDVDDAP